MAEPLSLNVLVSAGVGSHHGNQDHAVLFWVSASVDHSDLYTFDNHIFKFYCLFSALLLLLPDIEEARSHVGH